jgi:hypothetical protein
MRKIVVFIWFLLLNNLSHAAHYIEGEPGGSNGTHSWQDPMTWLPNGVPGAGDTVTITTDTITIDIATSVGVVILQGGAIKATYDLTISQKFDFLGGILRGQNNVKVYGQTTMSGGMKKLQTKLELFNASIWNNGDLTLDENPDELPANPCEGGEIWVRQDSFRVVWNNTAIPLNVFSEPECFIRLKGPCALVKEGVGDLLIQEGTGGVVMDTFMAMIKVDDGEVGEGNCGHVDNFSCPGGGGGGGGSGTNGGGDSGPSGEPGVDCDDNNNATTTDTIIAQKGRLVVGFGAHFFTSHAYEFVEGSEISGGGRVTLAAGYLKYKSSIPLSVDSLDVRNGSILTGKANITSKRIGANNATIGDSLEIVCDNLTLEKTYHTGSGKSRVKKRLTIKGSKGSSINRTIEVDTLADWSASKISFAKVGKIHIKSTGKINIQTGGGIIEYINGAGPVLQVDGDLDVLGNGGTFSHKIISGGIGGGTLGLGPLSTASVCLDCETRILDDGGGSGPGDDNDDNEDGEPDDPIVTDCGTVIDTINLLLGDIEISPGGKLILGSGFTKFGNTSTVTGTGTVNITGNANVTFDGPDIESNISALGSSSIFIKGSPDFNTNNIDIDADLVKVNIQNPVNLNQLDLLRGSLAFNANSTTQTLNISGGKLKGSGNIAVNGKAVISGNAILEGDGHITSDDTLSFEAPNPSITIKKPILVNGPLIFKTPQSHPSNPYLFKRNGGKTKVIVPIGKQIISDCNGTNTAPRVITCDSMFNPFEIHGTFKKIGSRNLEIRNGGFDIKAGGVVQIMEGQVMYEGIATHGLGSIQVANQAKLIYRGSSTDPIAQRTNSFPDNFQFTGDGIVELINSKYILEKTIAQPKFNITSGGEMDAQDSCTFRHIYNIGTISGPGHLSTDTFNMNYGELNGTGNLTVHDSCLIQHTNITSSLNIEKPIKISNVGYIRRNGLVNGISMTDAGSFIVPTGAQLILDINVPTSADYAIGDNNPGNERFKISGTLKKRGNHKSKIGGLSIKNGGNVIVEEGDLKVTGNGIHGDGSLQISNGSTFEINNDVGTRVHTFSGNFSLTGDGTFTNFGSPKITFEIGSGLINIDSINTQDFGEYTFRRRTAGKNMLINESSKVFFTDSITVDNLTMNDGTIDSAGHIEVRHNFKLLGSSISNLRGSKGIDVHDSLIINTSSVSLNRDIHVWDKGSWINGNLASGSHFIKVENGGCYELNNNTTASHGFNLECKEGSTFRSNGQIEETMTGNNIFRKSNIDAAFMRRLRFAGTNTTTTFDEVNILEPDTFIVASSTTKLNLPSHSNFGSSTIQLDNGTINDSVGNSFNKAVFNGGTFNGYNTSKFMEEVVMNGGTFRGNDSMMIFTSPITLNNDISLGDGKRFLIDSSMVWTGGDISKLTSTPIERLIINTNDDLTISHNTPSNCNVHLLNKGSITKSGNSTTSFANDAGSFLDLDNGSLNITGGSIKLGTGPHVFDKGGMVSLAANTELLYDPGTSSSSSITFDGGTGVSGSGRLGLIGSANFNSNSFITSMVEIKNASTAQKVTNSAAIHPKKLILSTVNARFENNGNTKADSINWTKGILTGTDTVEVLQSSIINPTASSDNKMNGILMMKGNALLTGTALIGTYTSQKGKLINGPSSTFEIKPTLGTSPINFVQEIDNYGTLLKTGVDKVFIITSRLTSNGIIEVDATGSIDANSNRMELNNTIIDNKLSSNSVIKGTGHFVIKAGSGILTARSDN